MVAFLLSSACGEDPDPQSVDAGPNDDAGPEPGDSGGGGGDASGSDGVDAGEDGGAAHEDAGRDAGEGDEDAGLDAGGEDDAGTDAGEEPFVCPGPPVTLDPGELPRHFAIGPMTLTITTLSASASFTLCEAPTPAVSPGARVGSVYLLDSDAASFAAEVSLDLAGVADELDAGSGGVAAIVLDAFVPSGAALPVDEPFMDLTRGSAGGSLSGSGYFGFRHLDKSATYAITHAAPEASYLTGEVIPLGVRLAVLGTPAEVRTAALTLSGCNVEPVGPEGTQTTADCGPRETLSRGANELPGAGELAQGASLDLLGTDAEPRFFCPFPGQGEVEAELALMSGTTRDLTLRMSAQVLCTQGLDLVAATNRYVANRLLHGPAFVSLAPYGVPTPHEELTFMSDAYAAALEPFGDGVRYLGVTGERSQAAAPSFALAAPNNAAIFAAAGAAYTASYEEASLPSREPAMDPNDIEVAYFPNAGGTLTASAGSASVALDAPGLGTLEIGFEDAFSDGSQRAPLPRVSFADGSAEYVYIRGLVREGSGDFGPDGFVRWLRASELPLAAGRRSFDLMTAEQWEAAGSEFNLTHLRVGFLNVTWDETRALWPGGRIVPVAGGVMLEGSIGRLRTDIDERASTACPDDPELLEPHPVTGCRIGPRQILLVTSGGKVEMFDPFDGSYEGTLIDTGASGPDGLVQVSQNWVDRCLYASQQTSAHGDGIWRYNHLGAPIELTPYIQEASITPRGLLMQGHVAFIANEQGGLVLWNSRPGEFGEMVTFDEGFSVGSVITDPVGNLFFSAGPLAGPFDRIRTIPKAGIAVVDWLTGLTPPEQISLDAADNPNMLIALGDAHSIEARQFASGTAIRTVDDVYTSERPRGVHPLLNDRWLVAGDGLGVDVMMPGTHVRTATDTPIASDSAFISSVCVPE